MASKRFSFFDNVAWYLAYLAIIVALIDSFIYQLPANWLGGKWFELAVLGSFGAILHFLRRFHEREQFTFRDVFKK